MARNLGRFLKDHLLNKARYSYDFLVEAFHSNQGGFERAAEPQTYGIAAFPLAPPCSSAFRISFAAARSERLESTYFLTNALALTFLQV